ncbi:MAG: system killer suppression protein [Mesorhizobium sp.]|uniref:system killer suppression protein n=1 Tax=Mesorhizobium sp. TaxID=1871066 RepID=UPI000FE77F1F|nr:system killer suppression protein [Mesorhizobium sp.]RWF44696.1 MAG: system killer suppression protein [Mesorhizobium sp.]
MDIDYVSRKLRRQMTDAAEMQKTFGQRTKPLQLRLGVLKNASTLGDVPADPPIRRHQLSGELAGHFAVVLKDNWRLVFHPDHDPVSRTEDGGIDLQLVTAIMIDGVEDYHGK